MTGPARLLSVRLQGFKSFAERTHLTFGPGISAIVGPNGSGKSNLADALRWTLGEQGRALRLRKAEDVIWAGSEGRPALGMADVQLVVDNADGLLGVDYGVVELGRRLYRSGENDYLLNRQRVRLRDLVDLLDSAHLADNAFLFIGQGMVDQALALRPEERRPLFEEVAGVRRHERRKRRSQEQLVESEANLARVDDILGELRPQARRLAAQAEQQVSRRSAGDDLAEAILAAAHARWHAAAARITAATRTASEARTGFDTAMAALAEHERTVATLAAGLAGTAAAESEARVSLDAAQRQTTEHRIEVGRIGSELAGVARDRERLAAERPGIEAAVARAAEIATRPLPARDLGIEAELAEAERALAEGLAESADAAGPASDDPGGGDASAIRRLEAAHRAEVETARRRLAEAERALSEEAPRAAAAVAARDAAGAARDAARADQSSARAAIAQRAADRAPADAAVVQAEDVSATATSRATALGAAAAGLRVRLEAAERAASEADRDTFAKAAVARGGRRLEASLVFEPDLRAAAMAALAGLDRAFVVGRAAVGELGRERGTVIVTEAGRAAGGDRDGGATPRRFLDLVRARGGGLLVTAIRSDDAGLATRLLDRAAWLPDLAACLELQPGLPPGWVVVPRDGSAVVGEVVVRLGRTSLEPDLMVEVEMARAQLADAEEAASEAMAQAETASTILAARRLARDAARTVEGDALAALRRLDEQERVAASAADAATREAAWLSAQVERLRAEVDRLRSAATPAAEPATGDGVAKRPARVTAAQAARASTWAARTAGLRARRDRLAVLAGEAEARRQAADRERASAETALELGRTRLAGLEAASLEVVEREARLQQDGLAADRAMRLAEAAEHSAREALDALLASDAADRARLTEAERHAGLAREHVALAQERQGAAERESLEARLGLESVREQVLVELAGLGRIGLAHLGSLDAANADEESALAAAVAAEGARWASTPPPEPPSAARLGSLRRRFHELGAGNPDAVEEYATLKARLDDLEAQRLDLDAAIGRTRALIVELEELIATQFRTTFAALEAAFERRFKQLFGGGQARLSLTDPADLAATGVEIMARPPGKKPQALAMLSGGERALTAVALLFAMLEVRPVPFCVLDEVDAALDEANIGRFTDALRDLSSETQCIVITHNRGTIEVADALYGVTVGEDSVSRVISLRLEDATALAGRSAGRTTPEQADRPEPSQATA